MSEIIVQKFGGTSVGSVERIDAVAEIVKNASQSNKIVVANTDTAFVANGVSITNQQHLDNGYANGNFTNQ